MTQPNTASNTPRPWRDPQRIADIAQCEANLRESRTERAGMIYMLAEILTALHRQADALESIDQRCAALAGHVASRLPSPPKGA
jgi:predicted ATPase